MGVATCYINIFIANILDHVCTAFLYTRCIPTSFYKNKRQRWHTSCCRLPYIPSNLSPKILVTSSSSAFSFVRDVLLQRLYPPMEDFFDPLEDASKTRTSVIKSSSSGWHYEFHYLTTDETGELGKNLP